MKYRLVPKRGLIIHYLDEKLKALGAECEDFWMDSDNKVTLSFRIPSYHSQNGSGIGDNPLGKGRTPLSLQTKLNEIHHAFSLADTDDVMNLATVQVYQEPKSEFKSVVDRYPDEKLFRLDITATNLKAYLERNDPQGFAQAVKNLQNEQQLLR